MFKKSCVDYFKRIMASDFIKGEIRVERGELTPEYQKIAKDELRETPEIVKQSLETFRELIKNDATIKAPIYDEFLIRFLRPTKFYPESAFQLLKRVLEFKKRNSSLLSNLVFQTEEKVFNRMTSVNVLADRDSKGRRILVLYPGTNWNPDDVDTDEIFKILYLIHQAATLEPKTQVAGIVVIIDFAGLSLKQAKALSPSFAYKLLTFCQDAMPLRLKEIHIINQPQIFKMIWQVFRPFIKEKLRHRIFFHGHKLNSLHQHIARSHLPSDFEGDLPKISYSGKDWYPELKKIESYIREWNECDIVKKHH